MRKILHGGVRNTVQTMNALFLSFSRLMPAKRLVFSNSQPHSLRHKFDYQTHACLTANCGNVKHNVSAPLYAKRRTSSVDFRRGKSFLRLSIFESKIIYNHV